MYNKKIQMMQYERENLRQQFKSRKSNITKKDIMMLCEPLGMITLNIIIMLCEPLGMVTLNIMMLCEPLGMITLNIMMLCEPLGMISLNIMMLCETLGMISLNIMMLCEPLGMIIIRLLLSDLFSLSQLMPIAYRFSLLIAVAINSANERQSLLLQ